MSSKPHIGRRHRVGADRGSARVADGRTLGAVGSALSRRPKHINRSSNRGWLTGFRRWPTVWCRWASAAIWWRLVPRALENQASVQASDTGRQQHLMPGTVDPRMDEREHRVVVTPDGQCEYAGGRFAALSAVARHITGVQWNGLRFGLRGERCAMNFADRAPGNAVRCGRCRVHDERPRPVLQFHRRPAEAGRAYIVSQRAGLDCGRRPFPEDGGYSWRQYGAARIAPSDGGH